MPIFYAQATNRRKRALKAFVRVKTIIVFTGLLAVGSGCRASGPTPETPHSPSATVTFRAGPEISIHSESIDGKHLGLFQSRFRIPDGNHKAFARFQRQTTKCWHSACAEVTRSGYCQADLQLESGLDYALRIEVIDNREMLVILGGTSPQGIRRFPCSLEHSAPSSSGFSIELR